MVAGKAKNQNLSPKKKTEPNVKAVKGCIYFSGGQGQKDKKHWNAAS